METTEALVKALWKQLQNEFVIERTEPDGQLPVFDAERSEKDLGQRYPDIDATFPRITYEDAMTRYGSDKPDLRIPNQVSTTNHHQQMPTSR